MTERWKTTMGFVEPPDIEVLQIIAKEKICLEIGSLYGRSTVCMADVAKSVYSVDTHKANGMGVEQIEGGYTSLYNFLYNIEGYSNIAVCVGRSQDIVPNFNDDFFDLVFIDGGHSYEAVIEDLKVSWPKLKINGVMSFHDYRAWPGITQTVDEYFKKSEINTHPKSCICWIIKQQKELIRQNC